MLERDGKWTTVVPESDRVIVNYARTYVRGAFAKCAVIAVLIGWIVFPVFFRLLDRTPAIIATSIIAALLAKWSFDSVKRSRAMVGRPYVVIFDRLTARQSVDAENCIHADDIELVEVRENLGRRGDDSALWQTYVHLRTGAALLIHQRIKWNHRAEVEIARSLADRWSVPLRANQS